jgi:hypothetical protein
VEIKKAISGYLENLLRQKYAITNGDDTVETFNRGRYLFTIARAEKFDSIVNRPLRNRSRCKNFPSSSWTIWLGDYANKLK